MDGNVELVPLLCIRCGAPLPAEPDEVAWVCNQCDQGMLLDEINGLTPLTIHFSAAIPEEMVGKPYWVAEGKVSLARETYSGNEERAAHAFWGQPRRFFVPAFACSLDAMLAVGMMLLRQPPDLQEGKRVSFEPVVLGLDDVRAVAEFIVMAIEAERKDKLKEVRFSLELSEPVLWVFAGQVG